MNKADVLQTVIDRKREEDAKNFERKVERLVWDIEGKSQELRDLKKELKDLTYQETPVPDVSDCIGED